MGLDMAQLSTLLGYHTLNRSLGFDMDDYLFPILGLGRIFQFKFLCFPSVVVLFTIVISFCFLMRFEVNQSFVVYFSR